MNARRNGKGRRIDGQRTDGVVRAVVVAGFVDGQRLENVQAVLMAPIHHLPDAVGIANAEVLFRADGEDRFQNAGQRLMWI